MGQHMCTSQQNGSTVDFESDDDLMMSGSGRSAREVFSRKAGLDAAGDLRGIILSLSALEATEVRDAWSQLDMGYC
eukprot:CAMPEP_0183599394 /NCGR_PEP_ID=MMETSP0371-20130417/179409_1 /TAXON_ID=268820 /ORGANISM="Peridinium aciculiferum, Strain PAER-2" /LENGTH=75 /DNA_ID=CAMNT_0025811461 /DNA_START=108 /DNA_END=335 /DNA_ORIENTATION=+